MKGHQTHANSDKGETSVWGISLFDCAQSGQLTEGIPTLTNEMEGLIENMAEAGDQQT